MSGRGDSGNFDLYYEISRRYRRRNSSATFLPEQTRRALDFSAGEQSGLSPIARTNRVRRIEPFALG
jgi:hypothetical protein